MNNLFREFEKPLTDEEAKEFSDYFTSFFKILEKSFNKGKEDGKKE